MKLKNRLKHTTNVTFDLIGITCPENIIRLSWLINHAFDFFLQCMDNSNINKIISTLKREPDINYVSLLENPEKELIQKLSI